MKKGNDEEKEKKKNIPFGNHKKSRRKSLLQL